VDDLDRLLAEYDSGMKSALDGANLAAPEQQKTEQPGTIDEIDRLIGELQQQQPADPATKERLETQGRELQQLREKQFWEGEDRAFEQVASADQKEFEQEFDHIDKDYIAKELKLLAMENGRFRNCWFGRGRDPSSWHAAHRIVLRQLHRECEQRQAVIAGRPATEDRAMVAASMRGAGAKIDIVDPAPQLGLMSDQEFRAYKASLGF
jgi:hypothetical protein